MPFSVICTRVQRVHERCRNQQRRGSDAVPDVCKPAAARSPDLIASSRRVPGHVSAVWRAACVQLRSAWPRLPRVNVVSSIFLPSVSSTQTSAYPLERNSMRMSRTCSGLSQRMLLTLPSGCRPRTFHAIKITPLWPASTDFSCHKAVRSGRAGPWRRILSRPAQWPQGAAHRRSLGSLPE